MCDRNPGLPEAMWTVVVIGFRVHLVMTILSGIVLSLLIFTIAAVDHPFRAGVSIGPDAFQLVHEQLESQRLKANAP